MAQPEKRIRVGGCVASIFANEIATESGKVQVRSVSLQRTYRGQDGEWKSGTSFQLNDLPKAQLALRKAYEYLIGLE